jgi:hypothetical protein
VKISSANQLISSTSSYISGGILQELDILSIIVAYERHGSTPAYHSCCKYLSWFVVFGEQRQALIRFSPHKEVQCIVSEKAMSNKR